MKVAIIDLGTNTCNLLIAEILNSDYTILFQGKELVKLGDQKIKTNIISDEAILRVKQAFKNYSKIINRFKVKRIKCLATSGIRSALNKMEFLKKVQEEISWKVEVIDGEQEAELIYKGVLLASKKINGPSVILDIGGGSNELILAHENKMLWNESQPTGMGRIINQYKISDPINEKEVKQLQNYFLQAHTNAFEKCSEFKVNSLIGCSGAFDTIADIIDKVNPGEKTRIEQNITLNDFYRVYSLLIHSTKNDRLKMKGMDMVRVDLIVPAVILIELIVSKLGISKITQTDYALREGVLYDELQSGF
jgi:exopolyphosphatase/guanosine-5'-triphosphate,3'-diphosphate pyrophosphatase